MTHRDLLAKNGIIHIIDTLMYEPPQIENNISVSCISEKKSYKLINLDRWAIYSGNICCMQIKMWSNSLHVVGCWVHLIFHIFQKTFQKFQNCCILFPYLESMGKTNQIKYKQAYIWWSGSWDNLWYLPLCYAPTLSPCIFCVYFALVLVAALYGTVTSCVVLHSPSLYWT